MKVRIEKVTRLVLVPEDEAEAIIVEHWHDAKWKGKQPIDGNAYFLGDKVGDKEVSSLVIELQKRPKKHGKSS